MGSVFPPLRPSRRGLPGPIPSFAETCSTVGTSHLAGRLDFTRATNLSLGAFKYSSKDLETNLPLKFLHVASMVLLSVCARKCSYLSRKALSLLLLLFSVGADKRRKKEKLGLWLATYWKEMQEAPRRFVCAHTLPKAATRCSPGKSAPESQTAFRPGNKANQTSTASKAETKQLRRLYQRVKTRNRRRTAPKTPCFRASGPAASHPSASYSASRRINQPIMGQKGRRGR